MHHLSVALRAAAAAPSPRWSDRSPSPSSLLHTRFISRLLLPSFFLFESPGFFQAVSQVKSAKRMPRGPPPADAPTRRSGRVASLPEQPKHRFEVATLFLG